MGVGYWQDHRGVKPETVSAHVTTSVRKLQPLTVPILSNGQVQGYVLARLSLEVDEKNAKAAELPPDPFVLDEAFRYLYAEADIDFRKLGRPDLNRIRGEILKRSSARLKSDLVKDVLIEEFNFVPREEPLK